MRFFYILFFVVLIAASCRFFGGERVHGDGHVVTQDRSVGSFHSLSVETAVAVRIRQEPSAAVKVEADQNLQEFIEVLNESGTLVIRQRRGYRLDPTRDVVVYVSSPDFRDLDVSGASSITGEGTITTTGELFLEASGASHIRLDVNAAKLRTDISGSSKLALKGQAREFNAEASGASDIDGIDLQTETARIDISGATKVEVAVSRDLDVEASGASHVSYKGSPRINQRVSGAASVRSVN